MAPGAVRSCRICPRCNRLLGEAGDAGRILKATGERWFPGHRVGLFDAKVKPRPFD
jgi:hypothetical protein